MQTLIKNGILYTMTEDKGIFQGDILVEGTKIKEVAEHISEDCLEDGDKLIEAEGYYVLPGLIDAHSHIGLFDFNVDPARNHNHASDSGKRKCILRTSVCT